MSDIEYTAYFVDNMSLLKNQFPPIYPNVFYHHATIQFRPNDINGINVGEKKKIKVVGRLTTDKVDVLLLSDVKTNNKHPHITLSTQQGIKPFQSNSEIENYPNMIEYFKSPIFISTTVGYMMRGKEIKENSNIKLKYLVPEDFISGGKSDNKSLLDLAKKYSYNDSTDTIDSNKMKRILLHLKKQYNMGIKVEMEHTYNINVAKEICMDHLFENPNYYSKLKKAGLADELK